MNSSALRGLAVSFGLSLSSLSCGGAPEPATPSTPSSPSTSAPAASAPSGAVVPWKDLNHEQRSERMRTVVLPQMKVAFAAYDPKRFGNITCGTCHGDGAKDGSFTMPNAKLPKVPKDPAGFDKLGKDQPDAMKFMSGTVEPKMAALLGVPAYDPKTDQGFGCHDCHTDR